MERFWQLRAFRRFWWVIIATTLVAAGAAWAVTETSSSPGPPRRTFQATTALYSTEGNSGGFGGSLNPYSDPKKLVGFLTTDEVLNGVKTELGYEGSTDDLAAMVEGSINEDTTFFEIVATTRDPNLAEDVSLAFTNQLLTFISKGLYAQNLAQADGVKADIHDLKDQIDAATTDQDTAQLTTQLDTKKAEYRRLTNTEVDPGFTIAGTRVVPVSANGFEAPRSLAVRLGIAMILGLLGGLALALLIGRLDTRIRTKRAAEERFGLPVLAEIPVLPRRARAKLITSSDPGSRYAEAFRILGAELVRGPRAQRRNGNGDQSLAKPPQVIMVTSAGPGEGKTTVAGNLAVALADTDRKVIVLSCDFRRPKIHTLFGVEASPGMAEFLADDDGGPILDRVAVPTKVDGVRLVPSGRVRAQPTELLHAPGLRRLVAEARAAADVVIIDTTPILAVSDAAFIAPDADAVLLVARSGRTTGEVAERTSELLARLGCPAIGVALNRAGETVVPKGYRAYYERRPSWSRPESGNGEGTKATLGEDAAPAEAADQGEGGDSPTSRVTSEEDRV